MCSRLDHFPQHISILWFSHFKEEMLALTRYALLTFHFFAPFTTTLLHKLELLLELLPMPSYYQCLSSNSSNKTLTSHSSKVLLSAHNGLNVANIQFSVLILLQTLEYLIQLLTPFFLKITSFSFWGNSLLLHLLSHGLLLPHLLCWSIFMS